MDDIGLEKAAFSLGNMPIARELATKLATIDIKSLWKTLGDKERIEAVLFLKQLRERSMLRQ